VPQQLHLILIAGNSFN